MSNAAALAAELRILTEALDDPDADVAHSLRGLMRYAAAAITTFLGVSVRVVRSDPPLAFSSFTDTVVAGEVRTSLHVVVAGVGPTADSMAVAVTFYAGSPGAFVDLAADLAWLTARPLSDYVIDGHLAIPPVEPRTGLLEATLINQAVGVLIGRGYTPEQAVGELDTRAARAGLDRAGAAQRILAEPSVTSAEKLS